MSEQQSILKRGMTPTHQMMVEWILQNPGGTLRQMGAHFGYSVSWLSQVINTDMFKSHLAQRQVEVEAVVTADIPTKLRGLASLAIERMHEVLEKTEDADTIKDSFDKVMNRYGYAPNSKGQQPVQQNNVFFLDQSAFKRVQEKLVNAHSNTPAQVSQLPAPKEDGELISAPQREEV